MAVTLPPGLKAIKHRGEFVRLTLVLWHIQLSRLTRHAGVPRRGLVLQPLSSRDWLHRECRLHSMVQARTTPLSGRRHYRPRFLCPPHPCCSPHRVASRRVPLAHSPWWYDRHVHLRSPLCLRIHGGAAHLAVCAQ
jgi:hypothetical protein